MSNGKYTIHLQGFKAVILYPALVTPSIVAKGTGCMTLVLATNEDFYTRWYLTDPEKKGMKMGGETARKFHSQLSFVKFGTAEIFGLTEYEIKSHVRSITSTKSLIYANHNAALENYASGNYQGWYLGKVDCIGPVKGYDADGKNKILGRLSPWAVNMYKERGYTELFQLNFKKFDNVDDPAMYEVAFTYAQHFGEYDIAGEHAMNSREISNQDISPGSGKNFYYTDPDDDVLKDYLKTHRVGWEPEIIPLSPADIEYGEDGEEAEESVQKAHKKMEEYRQKKGSRQVINTMPKVIRTPVHLDTDTGEKVDMYHMYSVSAKNDVECGYSDCTECKGKKDNDGPVIPKGKGESKHKMFYLNSASGDFGNKFIQTRHPVYIPNSWEGNIGVLGDLHISSRQAVYKLVRPQVIPGAKEEDSPKIGPRVHENLESVVWLMHEMGQRKCDLLAIVGDIFDHVTNLDPKYCFEELQKGKFGTIALWDILNEPEYLDNFDAYPQYIDLLQFLALVVDYYKKVERPLVAVNGNHEAYSIPYGISPHIGPADWEFFACNAGIPSDHNLPRYDATLLYGPGFGTLGVSTKLGWNFKPKCFDVFYCLLTPWSDFAFAYEGLKKDDGTVTGRQDFLTFGWGNTESFIKPALGLAGTLPRASNNFDHYQAQMLVDWTREKKGDVMLLSHFPFASYDPALPLNDKNAWVNSHKPSRYDWGSFNSPRGYGELFEGKIDYTLSGHTHRPAVYTPHWSNTESYKPEARYKDPGENSTLLTSKDTFLVCGSAGPYSKQNYIGELKGWGQLRPQGLILSFEGEKRSVKWVEYDGQKPRFAAVVDAMRSFEKMTPFLDCLITKEEVFRRGINEHSNKFFFKLNPDFTESLKILYPKNESKEVIAGASLHCVDPNGEEIAQLKMTMKKSLERKAQRGHPREAWSIDLRYFEADSTELKNFQLKCTTPSNAEKDDTIPGEAIKKVDNKYFMSVKFGGAPEIAKDYDLSYPWCFPVLVMDLDWADDAMFEQPFGIIKRDISFFNGSVADHEYYKTLTTFL